jgi:purine-nucleoside phosphorylase
VNQSAEAVRSALKSAHAAIRSHTPSEPRIAIILGTGLGRLANEIELEAAIPYADIPNFPLSTVESHSGRLIIGRLDGHRVVAMQGRFHRYEGYSLRQVTFPVRVLRMLGAQTLIVSNVSGGMNPRWQPGDLMIIDDHINMLGVNPLTGPNEPRWGTRFPDMSEVYSARLRRAADQAAVTRRVHIEHGVYLAVMGPSYETPAEIRAFRALGADAVGMSTVPEALVARHMGMEVLGISCIANPAAGLLPKPLSSDEVLAASARAARPFAALLEGILERI